MVAAGLMLLAVYATLDPPGPRFTGPVVVAWLAGAAVSLPIVLRHRRPVAVLGWVVAAAATATVIGAVGMGVVLTMYAPVALALYTAATVTRAVAAVTVLAGSLAASAASIVGLYQRTGITPADAPASEAPLWWQVEVGVVAVALTAAWAAGRVVRWRRAVRAELSRRSARDAVAAERLRIARELHDIVGHSMSLIAVKATVANHIAGRRPEEARAALATIEATSRAALTEMRQLLGVLRPGSPDEPAGWEPAPGIGDLGALAGRFRTPGLDVRLTLDDAGGLPEGAGLTVYRIVQESLTNVMKHAGASRCDIVVRARDGSVHVDVTDDGRLPRQPARDRAGQGLIGMRERVTVYGGSLSAGPRPDGGFRVSAEIPYEAVPEPALRSPDALGSDALGEVA